MNRKKLKARIMALLLGTVILAGCGNKASVPINVETGNGTAETTKTTNSNQNSFVVTRDMITYDNDDYYTDWTKENPVYVELSGSSANVKGSGATVDENKVTITSAGVYAISGKLEDGQIIVDLKDKGTVKIVLNGAEINSSNNSPLYVKSAEKVIVSLQEGTQNTIIDGEKYELEGSSEEPNAAIYSKANLTINGNGALTVKGNYNNGITSKDDLKVTGGNINVFTKDDGLMGRDMLLVKEGNIKIEAGGDGLKATNDSEASKGFIGLQGGSFDIKATKDGIQAETSMLIEGGKYTIVTGGGSANAPAKAKMEGPGGKGLGGNPPQKTIGESKPNSSNTQNAQTPPSNTNVPNSNNEGTTTTSSSETDSAKGIKAKSDISISGGTFNIDSKDDSIHSNNSVSINSGELTINAGDDGIHGDSTVTVKDGKINIEKSYEGIEGDLITFDGGETRVVSSDDSINVGGGADGSAVNGRPGQNNLSTSGNNKLNINGGYIWVSASGDGLDSNGSIYMNGGTVVVNGPTENNNGALDYDGEFIMKGGIIVSAGSSGMAQAPSDSSTQYSIAISFSSTQKAGTSIALKDSKENTIAAFTPEKDYGTVVISSPEIKKDGEYAVYSGGSLVGNSTNGIYAGSDHKDGTKIVSFKITNSVTWLNESGVTTAKTGGHGGGKTRP